MKTPALQGGDPRPTGAGPCSVGPTADAGVFRHALGLARTTVQTPRSAAPLAAIEPSWKNLLPPQAPAEVPALPPPVDAAPAPRPVDAAAAAAVPPGPLEGLRIGDRSACVARLQKVMARWNPRLDLGPQGRYTSRLSGALTLYKVIYGSGTDGSTVDARTAAHLSAMENGTFWNHPPAKSPQGKLLYHASQDLGIPYSLGGDGRLATDCGMMTRRAVVHAGLSDGHFSRMADVQYYYAERGLKGLHLRTGEDARPGDLIFFNNPTRQSGIAYQGVTHVGMYLGNGRMLAASSRHGRVVVQRMGGLQRYVKGYGGFG